MKSILCVAIAVIFSFAVSGRAQESKAPAHSSTTEMPRPPSRTTRI
jgi:hypothetical protein